RGAGPRAGAAGGGHPEPHLGVRAHGRHRPSPGSHRPAEQRARTRGMRGRDALNACGVDNRCPPPGIGWMSPESTRGGIRRGEPGDGWLRGLDTVRIRVLAAIAAGDYEHARELIELAAGLQEVERERLEQMISAAERGLTSFAEGALAHIFRDKAGHFAED